YASSPSCVSRHRRPPYPHSLPTRRSSDLSGGPLVDARGQIVGLCTSAFIRRSGTIIPVGTVGRITEELLSHGRVFRGYLGLGLQPAELPAGAGAADSSGGLLVAAVQAGGPAGQGGRSGGVILV